MKYLGAIVNENGIHSDPARVEALKTMKESQSRADVRSYVGLVNYYGKFIDRLHRFKPALETLLRKDVPFRWSMEVAGAFRSMQDTLAGPLLLAHYNPRQTLIVAADTCDTGIGGVTSKIFRRLRESSFSHREGLDAGAAVL